MNIPFNSSYTSLHISQNSFPVCDIRDSYSSIHKLSYNALFTILYGVFSLFSCYYKLLFWYSVLFCPQFPFMLIPNILSTSVSYSDVETFDFERFSTCYQSSTVVLDTKRHVLLYHFPFGTIHIFRFLRSSSYITFRS